MNLCKFAFSAACLLLVTSVFAQQSDKELEGVSRVDVGHYKNCIQLSNGSTKVVLGHHQGGRILKYELNGKNVLFLSETDGEPEEKQKGKLLSAGRFDVGPEHVVPRGPTITHGEFESKPTGIRQATMTSQIDPDHKTQVVRTIKLDEKTSKLTIQQTVWNRGDKPLRQCYWSRTFAVHGGVVVVPCVPEKSLLPNLYQFSRNRYLVDFRPEDEAIRRVDDFLVIDRPASYAKIGFDSTKGWAAYQTRENQLFVKKFPIDTEKKYGEPGQIHFAIWYPKAGGIPACEIEPISPLVELAPGESDTYQVEWWLLKRSFPKSGIVDPKSVEKTVIESCLGESK